MSPIATPARLFPAPVHAAAATPCAGAIAAMTTTITTGTTRTGRSVVRS